MNRVCCELPTGDAVTADVGARGRRQQDLTTMSELALVACCEVCDGWGGGGVESLESGARDRWPTVLQACEDPAPS